MVNRVAKLSKINSFFLFGNRGVGKSTLLKQLFPTETSPWFDLLQPEIEKRLALNPQLLAELLDEYQSKYPAGTFVIIDEIQKNPALLDIVHTYIEKKHFNFILTGSSSRKLKKQGVNLLGGRAFVYHLFPFTHVELAHKFNLLDVLSWGSLPKIFDYSVSDKIEYLNAYTNTYLREEIIAEQLVRQILPFRQFLEVAAQANAKIVNYSKIAIAINVDTVTVQNYFEILEDTFIGFMLQPFDESIRKRQRKNPKFYFFDTGVARTLQNKLVLPLTESTFEYGDLFEQFIILEFVRLNSYYKKSWKFSYLKTKDSAEIDLIIERPGKNTLFIEIKSANKIDHSFDSGLNAFKKLVNNYKNADGIVISRDPLDRISEGLRYLNWKSAFKEFFEI